MKGRLLTLIIGSTVVFGFPIDAHHLISEVYDIEKTQSIEGRVKRIFYAEPHSRLHLAVGGKQSRSRTWSVELEGAAKLSQQGLARETLRPGDRLRVCGNPGRDPSHYRLRMLKLERPSDGLSMEIQSVSVDPGSSWASCAPSAK